MSIDPSDLYAIYKGAPFQKKIYPSLTNGVQTGELNEPLNGWNANAVVVDNNTNQYLYLPDITRWINPNSTHVIRQLPGVGHMWLQWSAPPGAIQPPAVAGQQATLYYTAVELPETVGTSQQTIAPDVTLFSATPVLGTQIITVPSGIHSLLMYSSSATVAINLTGNQSHVQYLGGFFVAPTSSGNSPTEIEFLDSIDTSITLQIASVSGTPGTFSLVGRPLVSNIVSISGQPIGVDLQLAGAGNTRWSWGNIQTGENADANTGEHVGAIGNWLWSDGQGNFNRMRAAFAAASSSAKSILAADRIVDTFWQTGSASGGATLTLTQAAPGAGLINVVTNFFISLYNADAASAHAVGPISFTSGTKTYINAALTVAINQQVNTDRADGVRWPGDVNASTVLSVPAGGGGANIIQYGRYNGYIMRDPLT